MIIDKEHGRRLRAIMEGRKKDGPIRVLFVCLGNE